VEKVGRSVGQAAPAVVVAGALAAAPQASAAAAVAHGHTAAAAVTHQHAAAGVAHARLTARVTKLRTHTVRPGDTLAALAKRYYGSDGDWRVLYHANHGKIENPNMIFPGQVLRVPDRPARSASRVGAASREHHHHTSRPVTVRNPPAQPTQPGQPSQPAEHHGGHHADQHGEKTYHPRHAHHARHSPHSGSGFGTEVTLAGTLNCGGLEQLWDAAGGAPGEASTAASIAMAESGGDQFAVSATDDIGYWQINAPSWGSMASTDPMTNASAAVRISDNGANWTPWTTYTSGAYSGQC